MVSRTELEAVQHKAQARWLNAEGWGHGTGAKAKEKEAIFTIKLKHIIKKLTLLKWLIKTQNSTNNAETENALVDIEIDEILAA